MIALVGQAAMLAEQCLAAVLPRRWTHVQAVAAKAKEVSGALDPVDRHPVVAAAWLHDVGYAPDLVDTGFHPLDGARWLRRQSFDERVTALVAHHSCALVEAEERGLAHELLAEFDHEDSVASDALWFADMTTGPDGQDFDVLDRLAEVRARYGPRDVVARFALRAEPQLAAAVRRTQERLQAAGIAVQPM